MEPLFGHILVPIDGSEPSLQALQMALRMIRLCPACKLTVLYVIDKLVLNELVRFSKRGQKEVEAELEEQGRRYLELARKNADKEGVAAEIHTRRGDHCLGQRLERRSDRHGSHGKTRYQPCADRFGDATCSRLCSLPGSGNEMRLVAKPAPGYAFSSGPCVAPLLDTGSWASSAMRPKILGKCGS